MYSLLENEKVTNIRDNIQMTLSDTGELQVLNLCEFEIGKDNDSVLETNFFADEEDGNVGETRRFIISIRKGKSDKLETSPTAWMSPGESTTPVSWESFPEDMIPTIKKSCMNNYCVLSNYADTDTTFIDQKELDKEILDELNESGVKTRKAYDDLIAQIKKYKQADGVSNIEDFLDRYYFKKHILIQGAKGGGKTFAVDKMLREREVSFEFLSGHEWVDATDLVGYSLPSVSGSVWLDGPLTRAFRKALVEPTALFIDETLRVPAKELNVLVGAITPTSVGTYRLRTNHLININDGIGETEIIEVPMENLWVIGTTNVGAGYQVDDIDEALSDRFILVNKITSNSELEQILLRCAAKNGISDNMVSKLVSFYIQMKDLVLAGELEKEVNTRHLCETLQYAEKDSEVKDYLFDRMPSWTSTDVNGQPNKAEVKIITKLIKRIVKG